MKYFISLTLALVCMVFAAAPGSPGPGQLRMNADTTNTNTESSRVTVTQYTNFNSATVTATNWVQVGILGEDGIITLSSSDGTNSVDITMDSAGQFRIEPTTPDSESAFVLNMTTPHTVGPSFQLQNDGNIIFSIDSNSGWTNSGTLFLSDRGKFEVAGGGGGGTTINPTDGFLPVRSNSTVFADSLLFQGDSDHVSLINTNNSDPVFSVQSNNTNHDAGTFAVIVSDSDGTGSPALFRGLKDAGWDAGDPSQRDGDAVIGVLYHGAVNTRFEIDGTAGTTSIYNKDGVGPTFQVDGNSTAGNTRLLIWDVDSGALVRVSVGVADSGGTGFKLLRIQN